ncbi:LCP family protein [Lancefieldella rimae]|uniref:LCP family protein n=1 Tax=Lancefieldella rimae TaxID=1383 RepID=UPI0028E403B3|nr:LCP family protein [Lancefieldella rimae]
MAKWFSKKSKHMRDFDEDAAGIHANHADMDAFTRAEPSTTPQTLGNARQASVASAREAQGTFDSPFTREPLIGNTNAQDNWQARSAEDSEPHTARRAYAAPSSEPTHTRHARIGVAQHAKSRAEGVSAYAQKRRGSKRHRKLKIFFGIFATLLIAASAVALWWLFDTNAKLRNGLDANLQSALVKAKDSDPFYMLLLGVDKDEDRSENWGSDTSNFRADTIILARVDPKNKKITLISIPRDTMVDMGADGKQKINAAYSLGGAANMVKVVSKFANVNISHYAEVDFESFTKIVDSIGGVDVNLPQPVKDVQYAGIDLPAGEQTLNGEQALGLSRSRHAYDDYGGGDFYRAANQRMILMAIAKKVLKLDPAAMASAVSQIADSVTTDMSVTDIVGLALQFRGINTAEDMYSGRTPTESQLIDGVWYEIVDKDAWRTMLSRVEKGLPPLEDANTDETTGVTGTVAGDPSAESSIKPDYTGDVAVMNGTDKQGLAAQKAAALKTAGYNAFAENSDENLDSSSIIYDGTKEGRAKAYGVAKTLNIPTSAIKPNDGSYPTDVDITVILGAEQIT